ncbi:inorganic pyrophosphatase [Vulcanibacillus modesticaldus]|uniref:inorganic diphosphatase n=1 Tax=Vulcanibacillus modesticaldus TaxID=337097 RepID=A0A1D2YVW7_9BACI|nr:putative manganese-dependent inorganic diphosphatase [Vulcanibacillus modesticaldus]OEF99878.1 inorganic pyrophosphatase [Vulcanibacillus modesticaldus]
MTTLVFGHKNPDTDSVTSAISLSYLKNQLGYNTKPVALGKVSRETKYVLDCFKVEEPEVIDNVKIQLKDLELDRVPGSLPTNSIIEIYHIFKSNPEIKTVPIVDENNRLIGIVTMKDIAMGLMNGNIYKLDTTMANIINGLDGKVLVKSNEEIQGNIGVIAYYSESVIGHLNQYDIIIVGDRYKVIEDAIKSQVKLIIITGGKEIPEKFLEMAKENGVSMISVDKDTYTTSKLITQCNYVSSIMRHEDIIQFNENDYLCEVKEEMINSNFRNYPVVNQNMEYLGFVNKKEIINPHKKNVILVDHNEYRQSANGLKEANIIEIIDHHKIGDITTDNPINFRNMIVGSTCTIVYRMFKEYNVELPHNIAGLLISGIISDTLLLKSPTTTDLDKEAVKELNEILDLDLERYTLDMFKAGTSLEGYTAEEIFNRDFKEFTLETKKVGISQVFTLDIESVFERTPEFINYIKQIHFENEYFLTLMVVTDIMKNGSYLIYKSDNDRLISLAFDVKAELGTFVDGVVSRKKQVVPKITQALRML